MMSRGHNVLSEKVQHSMCLNTTTQWLTQNTVLSFRYDGDIKWKHFSCYWPFGRGIHRSPVNSPYKGQWRGALMFSLICACINGWVNNGEAGDLRRQRAHYDVIVMAQTSPEALVLWSSCCLDCVFEDLAPSLKYSILEISESTQNLFHTQKLGTSHAYAPKQSDLLMICCFFKNGVNLATNRRKALLQCNYA